MGKGDIMKKNKFRAWDQRENRFVYKGFYDRNWYFHQSECKTWKPLVPEDRPYQILEQYTELKDKNGKEIYEGDICYISGLGRITVVWDESSLGYVFTTDSAENEYNYQDLLEEIESITIIGNIHEPQKSTDYQWLQDESIRRSK